MTDALGSSQEAKARACGDLPAVLPTGPSLRAPLQGVRLVKRVLPATALQSRCQQFVRVVQALVTARGERKQGKEKTLRL